VAFINGFDMTTDLKTGLRAELGYWRKCYVLYAARVTKPRWHYAELQGNTQRWDLLLAKEGERIEGWGTD
jgi:hypothetical protein